MSKDAVSDWDTDPDANTDVGGVNLAEGQMVVSAVNNAMREIMAQIADAGFLTTTAAASVVDSNFSIIGSGDATKKLAFEIDTNVPTATTVTLTVPASSGTISLIGLEEEFIPAGAFIPQITDGPQAAIVELSTNKQPLTTLNFDASTQEYAVLGWIPKKRWNGGTIIFVPYWTAASGSGGVVWSIDAVAVSNDDALDAAYGTARTSADTLITANDCHVGPPSSAITIAGSPADADYVWLRISRATGNASDDLDVDASLLGIVVRWTSNAGNDA